MKTNAIIRIIIFSIVICLLLLLLAAGIHWRSGGFGFFRFRSDKLVPVSDINDMDGIDGPPSGATQSAGFADASTLDKLSIDWVSGTITIRPGDTDNIQYQESGVTDSKYQMVVKMSGSTLHIEFCKDGLRLNWPNLTKDLTVTVPRDWICQELEIDAASATVDLQDLTVRELDLDTASGTCRIDRCNVEEMDVDTASGDVDFSGTLNRFDCDSASAKITLVLDNIPRHVTVDTASGDVDLTLPADAGFTAEIDGMSTRFSSEFSTTTQNGRHVCGDGGCEIKVDAMSADVTIRKGT